MNYQAQYRVLDHHGILHLSRPHMLLGEALCGWPPIGTQRSDPAPSIYPPGEWTRPYRAICPTCNTRNTGTEGLAAKLADGWIKTALVDPTTCGHDETITESNYYGTNTWCQTCGTKIAAKGDTDSWMNP